MSRKWVSTGGQGGLLVGIAKARSVPPSAVNINLYLGSHVYYNYFQPLLIGWQWVLMVQLRILKVEALFERQ